MAFQKISGLLNPTTDAYTAKLNKLFGNGLDGSIIYTGGVTYLNRDFYFTNLTVNSGATLFTNGFKIFVKETLTNNGTVGMPAGTAQTTAILGGTVLTRNDGNIGYNSANAVGNLLTASQITNFDELIAGSKIVNATNQRIFAGDVGATGTSGASGSSGTANAGGAGTGGGSTAGNPGTAGTGGTGGTGGASGQGGGIVVILAKIVTGSGTFISEGTIGNPGNVGNPGNPGTSGNTGTTSPGTAHPGNPFSHGNPPVHHGVHVPEQPIHHATPPTSIHTAAHDGVGTGIAHNIAQPTHHHVPGNPFHNPGSHGTSTNPGMHHGGSHIAAHHRPTTPKNHIAAHTRASTHTAGNPFSHHTAGNQGHNAARGANGHNIGNQHIHPTSHPVHIAASNSTHINPDAAGSNPATHNHASAPGTPTTGTNPVGHNASFPGGAAGTGNPGNPGDSGNPGTPGQVGVVVVLGQQVTPSVSTSTVVADID